ncbi:LysR family transcriptional regulator [Microvirgula aerodenitrificans]|uniref:LysR family transcriptional regulator n=1 Tax=Microvirgula aerodenitrificans TaxID=57480 RepID=UPI0009FF49D9|nr:LysR family transcriptional regulator [Microvirgula aerodenitrificans]
MFDDISLFVQIVRAGNFSKASKQLGIPANTLGRRLSGLEIKLGTPLLTRSTRSLSCTPDGERLYKWSGVNIDSLDTAINFIRSGKQRSSEKVHIQVPISFFEIFQKSFFFDLLKFYPELELNIHVSDDLPDFDHSPIKLLLTNKKTEIKNCTTHKICNLASGFYASEAYLDQHGTPATPEDLANHNCIYRGGGKSINVLLPYNGISLPVRIKSRFTTNSISGIIDAAEQGLGIAIISEQSVNLTSRKIVKILPQCQTCDEELYAAYPNNKKLSAGEKAVFNYAVARMTTIG